MTESKNPQDFKTLVLTAMPLNTAEVKWGGIANLEKVGRAIKKEVMERRQGG